MITSSKFFKKTLFGEEEDDKANWVQERPYKVAEGDQSSKKFVVERINRSILTRSPDLTPFKKKNAKLTLPSLSNEIHVDSQRQSKDIFSIELRRYEEEFNFLRQGNNSKRKRSSFATQR
jgi:hypothetical protein